MQKNDFNFLKTHVYLDSAAGTLKPNVVLAEMQDFYLNYPLNPHSTNSKIGAMLAQKFQATRQKLATLFEASPEEVIFTSGATDSLNKFALMIQSKIKPGDEILLSYANHASAIIPFLEIAKKQKAKIVLKNEIVKNITTKTKLIVLPQVGNSIKYQDKWADIVAQAKKVQAILVNDAAQAVTHQKVSLKQADAIVISGNKLYGPTGTGALVVRKKLLQTLKPQVFGGGATAKIDAENLTWSSKGYIGDYEAGTPNTAGIIGLGAAITYFEQMKLKKIWKYEKELALYAFQELSKLPDLKLYSQPGDVNIFFNHQIFNAQDVVSSLGHQGIILRSGTHCAHLTSNIIKVPNTIRLSIAFYNDKNDINQLIQALKKGDFLDFI